MYISQIDIGKEFFGYVSPLGQKDLGVVGRLVSIFINVSFIAAGLILLFYLILGGIGMISGAGDDDPQKAEAAKKTATSALLGFVVVFASYWIVQLIEQLTGLTILGTK